MAESSESKSSRYFLRFMLEILSSWLGVNLSDYLLFIICEFFEIPFTHIILAVEIHILDFPGIEIASTFLLIVVEVLHVLDIHISFFLKQIIVLVELKIFSEHPMVSFGLNNW